MRKNFSDIIMLRESLKGVPSDVGVAMFVKNPWHSQSGLAYVGAFVGSGKDDSLNAILCLDDRTQSVYAVEPGSVDEIAMDCTVAKLQHQAERGHLIPVVSRTFPDGQRGMDFMYLDKSQGGDGVYRHYPVDAVQRDILADERGRRGGETIYDESRQCFLSPSEGKAIPNLSYALSQSLLYRNDVRQMGNNDYRVIIDHRSPSGINERVAHFLSSAWSGSFHLSTVPARDNAVGMALFRVFSDAQKFSYEYNRWERLAIDAAVDQAENAKWRDSWKNEDLRHIGCYVYAKGTSKRFMDDPCGDLVSAIRAKMPEWDDSQRSAAEGVIVDLKKMGYSRLLCQTVGVGRDVFFDRSIKTSSGSDLVGFHAIGLGISQPCMAYVITPDGDRAGRMSCVFLKDVDVSALKEGYGYMTSRWERNPLYKSPQRLDAVLAHAERVKSSSQKVYTPEQAQRVRRFLEEFSPDHREAVAAHIADSAHSLLLSEGRRVPQKWEADARSEILSLAVGVSRSEAQGMKR